MFLFPSLTVFPFVHKILSSLFHPSFSTHTELVFLSLLSSVSLDSFNLISLIKLAQGKGTQKPLILALGYGKTRLRGKKAERSSKEEGSKAISLQPCLIVVLLVVLLPPLPPPHHNQNSVSFRTSLSALSQKLIVDRTSVVV